MTDRPTIAIDAMGGDQAPDMVIRGTGLARERFPEARYLFFGDEARIAPLLSSMPALAAVSEIRHTDGVITNDAKPSTALRSGRDSSMWLAIEAVREGEAGAVVSAGNTGALMAIAKFILRTPKGVDRPAIASFFPTRRGETVMLDLGANIECDERNLFQFAVFGANFARAVLGIERPSVGLLNVGSEDLKGNDAVRGAATLLREADLPLLFHGFVEGNDITWGTVDVVVTDGFTGNVALKTAEGTSKLYAAFLRGAFRSSVWASIGYMLARPALERLRRRLDPRRYNGAVFLGLNGVVVKSHGGSDAYGFGNAVGVGVDMVKHGFIAGIRDDVERMDDAETTRKAADL